MTVKDLKKLINENEGIPKEKQRLDFVGKKLEDGLKL